MYTPHLVLLRLTQSKPSGPAQASPGQAKAELDGATLRVFPEPKRAGEWGELIKLEFPSLSISPLGRVRTICNRWRKPESEMGRHLAAAGENYLKLSAIRIGVELSF